MNWQQKLLTWYQKHKRDLPWRRTSDPYKIWVSEIMLQQTTVETVIPYYERFLKRFPTIQALAEAPEDDVLQMWSGLGYYSRARNLQKGAKNISHVPQTVEELLKIPGIGRYTAGAIASIAFNQPAPILDGNVMRVLSRIYRMVEDPKSTQGQKVFWAKSIEVIKELPAKPAPSYGDFNQALMELGATVCTPTRPMCLLCPLSSDCHAYQEGDADLFPKIEKKTVYVDVLMTAAVVRRDEKILMIRRPDKGLLKKMWELPMVEGGVEDLQKEWPFIGRLGPDSSLSPIRHSVLNKRLKITPVVVAFAKKLPEKNEHCWIHPDEIHSLPTSSMNKKILRRLTK